MIKKLLFGFIILSVAVFGGCVKKVVIMPTEPQEILFEQPSKEYPIRIGLKNENKIIHFSATGDFRILDAVNDSLLKLSKANDDWVCIFPENIRGQGEVWRLQIGAFKTQEAVDRFLENLQIGSEGKAYVLYENEFFKIRVGNFKSREDVLQFKTSLNPNYTDAFPVKISIIPDEIGEIEIISPDQSFVKSSKNPIKISPVNPENFVLIDGKPYRGELELGISTYGKNYVSNLVAMEDYLKGVLPSEMNYQWGMEALKSQAIAARTQTLNRLGKHKEDGYDLCNAEHCQVYKGVDVEKEKTNKAVDDTKGEILVYEGKIIEAVFFANCGGHTESAKDIWGNDIDYLIGTRDFIAKDGNKMPTSEKEWEKWY